MYWYEHLSHRCDARCRVPRLCAAHADANQSILVLEDLDEAGYPIRFDSLSIEDAMSCVDWLANFHARFIGADATGLWPVGTYWHLETRPHEFAAMESGEVKNQAAKIDRILNSCSYKTLVHGDAKVANFCFAQDHQVAVVDFQYTGGGCGMKDLAYFIGSCFDEDECESYEDTILDRYFETLTNAIGEEIDASALEREWRTLYPLAWTDFYRFLIGWMPTHKKIHRYTNKMAEQTFERLPRFQDQLS